MPQSPAECVFCKIYAGEIPGEFLFKDDRCFVIRDISPVAPVHLLAIPVEHYIHAEDASPEAEAMLGHLMLVARVVARLEGVYESGYRMAVNQGPDAGQTVDHLHLHVIGGRRLEHEG